MIAETTHTEFTRDDIYEVLANKRRRFVIHYLQHCKANAPLGEIAEHVAAWENEITISEVGSDERKNVYTSLQQFHLPKMEDLGIVTINERQGAVELSEPAAEIDVYTEVVGENELPWSMYYLSLGGLGGSVITGSTVGTVEYIDIDPIASAVFTITSVCVLAVFHTYYMRQNQIGENETPPEIT